MRTKVRLKSAYGATLQVCAALVTAAFATGCSRAPSFSILGSFFPAWLVCILAGMVLATVSYRALVYFKLEQQIVWSIVVYPCIALCFACVLWLIFFS